MSSVLEMDWMQAKPWQPGPRSDGNGGIVVFSGVRLAAGRGGHIYIARATGMKQAEDAVRAMVKDVEGENYTSASRF